MKNLISKIAILEGFVYKQKSGEREMKLNENKGERSSRNSATP